MFGAVDYFIIILIIIFIFYYYSDNIKEHYTTSWTPFSMANQKLANTQCTAVNINPANFRSLKNYGNFGIIGKFPAIPICDSCGLEFDCMEYPYKNIDEIGAANVCRKCNPHALDKNYNILSKPLYVFARATGRPRQCRRII